MDLSVAGVTSLTEWRRLVSELYVAVRADPDPEHAWRRWTDVRRTMFATHAQSPIPVDERGAYRGPFLFGYDPSARVSADLRAVPSPEAVEVEMSDGDGASMVRFAEARFRLFGHDASLDVFWLTAYGGGLYLSFRDATSGVSTYGGGRYLLDTVKGADLGMAGDRLVLDFNFAYQPSCSYDPRWSCPLPPPQNRLAFDVLAGERIP
jgi:uncharacterized protein